MHDYEVSISDDRSRLILERRRKALDEIEQSLTTGRDMGAMLNVVRGTNSVRPLGSPVC
jgi:hypothetical protein